MWLFSLGENFAKMMARHFMWGNFHETTPISFINAYGFYFRLGVIFAKKTKARKTRKLPSRQNYHVYSTWKLNSPNLLCLTQRFMLLCVTITAGKSKSPLQGIPTLSGTFSAMQYVGRYTCIS